MRKLLSFTLPNNFFDKTSFDFSSNSSNFSPKIDQMVSLNKYSNSIMFYLFILKLIKQVFI